MSILVANDHEATVRRLTFAIKREIPDQVVIPSLTIDDAIETISSHLAKLQLGFIDYHFGDSMLGEEHKGTRIIREWRKMETERAPDKQPAHIVLASGSGFQEDYDSAMEAGADGILDMSTKPEQYIAALHELLRKVLCNS